MVIATGNALQNMAAYDFMLCYIWPVRKSTATKNNYIFRDSDKFLDAWSFINSSQYEMNLLESIYYTKYSINKELVY
jgi:hypothetical protein